MGHYDGIPYVRERVASNRGDKCLPSSPSPAIATNIEVYTTRVARDAACNIFGKIMSISHIHSSVRGKRKNQRDIYKPAPGGRAVVFLVTYDTLHEKKVLVAYPRPVMVVFFYILDISFAPYFDWSICCKIRLGSFRTPRWRRPPPPPTTPTFSLTDDCTSIFCEKQGCSGGQAFS